LKREREKNYDVENSKTKKKEQLKYPKQENTERNKAENKSWENKHEENFKKILIERETLCEGRK
jgi:hypothetical protein